MRLLFGLCLCTLSSSGATVNWTNTPNATGYAPGDTVRLWGTFTNALSITNSGTVGNPITFVFQLGANFTSGCWDGVSGAIEFNNRSNIVVDGGLNGLIQNTNNGTILGTSNASVGISGFPCWSSTIKNLTITNIYRRLLGSTDQTREGYPIIIAGSDITVSNCVVSDGDALISYGGSAVTQSNIFLLNNRLLDFNHGYNLGIGDTNAYLTNLIIAGNYINPRYVWNLDNSSLHTDSIIILNNGYSPSSIISGCKIYNNNFDSEVGTFNTAAIFVDVANPQQQFRNSIICNNLFRSYRTNVWGNGFVYASGTNLWVLNNTCIGASDGSSVYGSGMIVGGTNAFIYNNINNGAGVSLRGFTGDTNLASSGDEAYVVFLLTNYVTGIYSDKNIFFGVASPGFGVALWSTAGGSIWSGILFSTLAQWQTLNYPASGYGVTGTNWAFIHCDPHSTTNVPNLSAGFVPLSTDTVARLAGTNLTAIYSTFGIPLTDYYGSNRPSAGNWTIGAFEASAPPYTTITTLNVGTIIQK